MGKEAIVIGASIAGMMAARVLSDHYEQVTILERDTLPDEAVPRRGAPQGHHAHLMLKRGSEVISELFPNFYEELERDHHIHLMNTGDISWFHFGVWKKRFESELSTYLCSRPLLEGHMRHRLEALGNIRWMCEVEVLSFLAGKSGQTLGGLQVKNKNSQDVVKLHADLIVDASGRASQTPRWLELLGYDKPQESHVTMNVGYASRLYKRPTHLQHDWEGLVIYPTPPATTKAGYIFNIEKDLWIVTLMGFAGDHPPRKEEGFLEFARQLDRPDIYDQIVQAEPLNDIQLHKIPSNQRRHYEKLSQLPNNLIVIGDALCSFNPIYGQGMTICALEALLLQECLQGRTAGDTNGLSRQYFRKAARMIASPWLAATGEDFRYPQTVGKRPIGTAALNWYKARLFESVSHNQKVAKLLYELQFLTKNPLALFHPTMLAQAVKSGIGISPRPGKQAEERPTTTA